MEATRTFGRTRIGKRALAVLAALLAAFVLGGTGGYVARSVTEAPTASHAGSAPLAQSIGIPNSYRPLRSGPQIGDDSNANSQSSGATAADDACILINRLTEC